MPSRLALHHICLYVSYFFGYKTDFLYLQKHLKNLGPSNKTDLDLWDCLEKVKLVLWQKFHRTDSDICSHSRKGNTLSYSRINTVFLKVCLKSAIYGIM